MALGIVYTILPEPINAKETLFFEAGVVRIGLEVRSIDNASLQAAYANSEEDLKKLEAIVGDTPISDGGVSLHVLGTDDNHEYLRFDCFEDDPHYHYIHRTAPGEMPVNHWVPFDQAACGDMLEWTLTSIRTRLPAMLSKAKGDHLVPGLNEEVLADTLRKIEDAIEFKSQ